MTHPFFSSGDHLDSKKIFALGFLYCRGTAQEKVDAIFSIYDKNGDGTVFVNAFRKIVKVVVATAICVMPQIIYNLDVVEAEEKTYDDV